MKNSIFVTVFLFFCLITTTLNAQNVPATNWYHSEEKDWVTIPGFGFNPTPAQLKSWGYTTPTPILYWGSNIKTKEMIAINRWRHPGEKDWVTLPETYATDATLTSWGYTNKSFAFYAYPTYQPGTVRVNLWYNQDVTDYVSLPENYVSEEALNRQNYYKSSGGFFYAYMDFGFPAMSFGTIESSITVPKEFYKNQKGINSGTFVVTVYQLRAFSPQSVSNGLVVPATAEPVKINAQINFGTVSTTVDNYVLPLTISNLDAFGIYVVNIKPAQISEWTSSFGTPGLRISGSTPITANNRIGYGNQQYTVFKPSPKNTTPSFTVKYSPL